MSTGTDMAKEAIHDKLASQITAAVSRLEALKARADAKMAGVEIVGEIAEHLVKKQGMHQELQELKKSGSERWDSAKHDLETRIADFEKSVNGIESKLKAG